MSHVNEIYGVAFEGGTAVLMARVAFIDGVIVEASDISAIVYSIFADAGCHAGATEAVTGHSEVAIDASQVFSDSLTTDSGWDVDAIGFNFRHEIDVASTPAFPVAGKSYTVRYKLQPVNGQPFILRFVIKAI